MLCVLHIGGEKTGTTSLQKFFGANSDALLRLGFCYPQAFAHPPEYVHRGLSDALASGVIDTDSDLAAPFKSEMDAAAELGVSAVVLSSEFFHSQINQPELVQRTHRYLSQFFDRFRIVFYARRQDHTLASMHSTAVRGGWSSDRNAMSVYKGKGHYYFDQLAICDNWAGVFGKDALTCRIFERDRLVGEDIIEDFATLIGLNLSPEMKRYRSNELLSIMALDALCLMRKSRHRNNKEFRQKLLNTDRQYKGARIPFLTSGDAARFVAKFEDSNRAFFEKYVDPDYAPCFSDGFDRFPVSIPPVSPGDIIEFIFSKP